MFCVKDFLDSTFSLADAFVFPVVSSTPEILFFISYIVLVVF